MTLAEEHRVICLGHLCDHHDTVPDFNAGPEKRALEERLKALIKTLGQDRGPHIIWTVDEYARRLREVLR